MPVTLLHHEEHGDLGTEVDAKANWKGAGARSDGEGAILR